MSQQESMFMPPERLPSEREIENARPIRTDEEGQWKGQRAEPTMVSAPSHTSDYSDYGEGYQAYDAFNTPQQGEKLRPPDPLFDNNRNIFFILSLLAALCVGIVLGTLLTQFVLPFLGLGLLVIAIIAVLFIATANRQTIALPPKVFEVVGQAHLHVSNEAGTIHIERSNSQHVEIRSTLRAGDFFIRTMREPVHYTQDGDHITIASRNWNPVNFLTFVTVTHTILVPDNSTIEINDKAGELTINGFQGQVKAQLNSGSITVTQAHLYPASNLQTNVGTIRIEQSTLNQGTRFNTNVGTVHVQQSHLEGDNTLTTNTGTVYVEGTLAPSGVYNFKTNMGTVHVALPATSAFILSAKTNMGTVENDFGSDSVGSEQQAHLYLHSDMGTIRVERR